MFELNVVAEHTLPQLVSALLLLQKNISCAVAVSLTDTLFIQQFFIKPLQHDEFVW